MTFNSLLACQQQHFTLDAGVLTLNMKVEVSESGRIVSGAWSFSKNVSFCNTAAVPCHVLNFIPSIQDLNCNTDGIGVSV